MSDDNKVPLAEQPTQTHIEHSCYEWNHIGYHITPEYTAAYCCICDSIVGFKWLKPWRRIISLFTDEPDLRRALRYRLVIMKWGWRSFWRDMRGSK